MTKDEAITELRRIRYQLNPTLTDIARLSGLHTQTLYRAINAGHLTGRSLARLTGVLRGTTKQSYYNYRPQPLPKGTRGYSSGI